MIPRAIYPLGGCCIVSSIQGIQTGYVATARTRPGFGKPQTQLTLQPAESHAEFSACDGC